MRICTATATALGLFYSLLGSPFAGARDSTPTPDQNCERLVEFRDGTILRVNLPAGYQFEFRETAGSAGEPLDSTTFRLDSVASMRFSRLPALEQLRIIQDAVALLRADNFKTREQALRTLVSGGKGFRPFIEDLFQGIADPESRWRLAAALEYLPPQHGIYEHAYDEIVTGRDTIKGDIKTWEMTADYRGQKLQLNRNTVRAIRLAPKIDPRGDTPIIATTEPIRKDLDVLFPDDCIRIDFDHDSKGDPLRPGQDISRRFIIDGVSIDTSIEGAIFSVNDFEVSGRSGGQSGATHLPLYHGTITLTFCVPGNELEFAGVTHVGLYVAIVQEGGTTLAAFDAFGHQIASVTTEGGPHEFLGLRSNVPIHQVKIIPNEDIDPDVTIDDIVFSVPEALDAGGAQNAFSLDFATGERLVCNDFEITEDSLVARPSGEFSAGITFPYKDLLQLHTPTENHDKLPPDDERTRFWFMLDDGSTLLACGGKNGQQPTTLLRDLPLASFPLTALWSESRELFPLPADTKLLDGQVAAIAATTPVIYTLPEFTEKQFTIVKGDATVEYSYNRLPSVWLKNPDRVARDRASGFIRLNTGERIVLGDASTFQMESFDSDKVVLKKANETFRIPLETITSLRLPKLN